MRYYYTISERGTRDGVCKRDYNAISLEFLRRDVTISCDLVTQFTLHPSLDLLLLLPMHLADFRVQYYAHKSLLERVDGAPGGRKKWAYQTLADYLHKILVLRNMHDKGGADVPIIVTAWDEERTKLAMEYLLG
ncbi:hypothetical protein DFH07DRAFT_808752 [Mycena maculata]|uniref:Uncharacterized protein n=1 Tax=Mycena maculata TaxID=230809 RepID=A0AAD7JM68_9AGAR|nr:hypothetical protein DFH07DRAFT_808752 [Mycena maculata]